jgi:SnoaL-like polyketide cyclase
MSIAFHKATVRRYFEEALDQRKLDILDEIVTRDCIIHRPETNEPIRGLDSFKQCLERILQAYSEFNTTIHDLIEENDRVHRRSIAANGRAASVAMMCQGSQLAGQLSPSSDSARERSRKNGCPETNSAC